MNQEQAKFLAEFFATALEQEGRTTAKVIAAVREDGRGYKPDEKSRSAWDLATHLATGDIWFLDSICDGAFNFDPEGEKKLTAGFKSIKDVVEFYTREFPKRVQRLRSASPESMAKEVDFFGVVKMPAAALLSVAMNHGVHHRGQLAAYLRPMGSKVPSIYGGSADEPMTGA
jgi:uncharacterized damage-inducible protein DinB